MNILPIGKMKHESYECYDNLDNLIVISNFKWIELTMVIVRYVRGELCL